MSDNRESCSTQHIYPHFLRTGCQLFLFIAAARIDYVPESMVYIFDSAGEKCRNVLLIDDNEVEGNHFISAILSSNSLGIFAEGSESITILDTDGKKLIAAWAGFKDCLCNFLLCLQPLHF